jgi:hypothetical protein
MCRLRKGSSDNKNSIAHNLGSEYHDCSIPLEEWTRTDIGVSSDHPKDH